MPYNLIVDLDGRANLDVDKALDALDGYHAALGTSDHGRDQVTLTLPADDLRQAVVTGLAVIAAQLGRRVLSVEAMPTDEFDKRAGIAPLPELLSITDAAELMGVSRQAVHQRLESGSLGGQKVGTTWVVPRAAIVAAAARTDLKREAAKAAVRRARGDNMGVDGPVE